MINSTNDPIIKQGVSVTDIEPSGSSGLGCTITWKQDPAARTWQPMRPYRALDTSGGDSFRLWTSASFIGRQPGFLSHPDIQETPRQVLEPLSGQTGKPVQARWRGRQNAADPDESNGSPDIPG
ncbi:MAG: hypothetical protein KGI54_06110 [Pseudomonadota bacterium]|nr:hypothetical protein [Pseudomonadota bacterium]